MNKTWSNLIILGILIMVAAVSWEIFQNNQGYRSKIDTQIIPYKLNTLVGTKLEKHINNDLDFANSNN